MKSLRQWCRDAYERLRRDPPTTLPEDHPHAAVAQALKDDLEEMLAFGAFAAPPKAPMDAWCPRALQYRRMAADIRRMSLQQDPSGISPKVQQTIDGFVRLSAATQSKFEARIQ